MNLSEKLKKNLNKSIVVHYGRSGYCEGVLSEVGIDYIEIGEVVISIRSITLTYPSPEPMTFVLWFKRLFGR